MSRYTCRFALLQGFYWVAACLVYSFAERFLTAHGFSVEQVGLVLATANGAALLLQPLMADLADRPNGVSLKAELLGGAAFALILALGLCFPTQYPVWIAVLFGALAAVTLTVQPLCNAVGMAYVDQGVPVDYSLGRGVASAIFAVCCYGMGYLAEWRTDALLWVYAAANVGLAITALLFAPQKRSGVKAIEVSTAAELLKKHPYLKWLLPGTVLLFAVHNFINAYMLSIVSAIGRGTHEMSVGIALAAAVEIPSMAGFSLLQKRFRMPSLLRFASCAFLVKHLIMLLPLFCGAGVWAVYLSQGVQMFGYAIFIPAASFFLNDRMDAGDKVKGQMLVTESQTLGCILGQLVGGFAIARIGLPVTMLIGCGLTAIGVLLLMQSLRNANQNAAA